MIEIIGFGHIFFYDGIVTNDEIEKLADRMEQNEAFQNVQRDSREISFEMSGNKKINYEELEKIKKEFIDRKAKFEVYVSEYIEGEMGFYYKSEE